jgi:hypothetical protein
MVSEGGLVLSSRWGSLQRRRLPRLRLSPSFQVLTKCGSTTFLAILILSLIGTDNNFTGVPLFEKLEPDIEGIERF